jgi:hypothetical protein
VKLFLHASLVTVMLSTACLSSAHAQKLTREQAAMNAAIESLTAAIAADSTGNAAYRVRLAAEIELAQDRWRLTRMAAGMDLSFALAAATGGIQPDPEHNGPQARGQLAQQFSQAISVYNQAVSQATQMMIQKESEAYQGHAQRANAGVQTLSQTLNLANQQFSQAITAGDLGPGVELIEPAMPSFETPPPAPDKDPAAACKAQIEAARAAYARAVQDARDAALAEAHTAAASNGSDTAKIQAALTRVSKRFQITAYDAFDVMDIAVKAALRKYELSTLD